MILNCNQLVNKFFSNILFVLSVFLMGFVPLSSAETLSNYAHADFLIRKNYQNSFSGRYMVQNAAQTKTFEIEHAYLSKGNHTIVRATSAPERALLFEDHKISFFAKDAKGFTQSNLDVLRKFPLLFSQDVKKSLATTYAVKNGGAFRIANRTCDEIILTPKESNLNRYSQKLCVDRITKLVLRQILYLNNEEPLETLVFSEIMFKKISADAFKPEKGLKSIHHRVLKKGVGALPKEFVDDIPKAFQVIAYNKVDQIQHFVLSDGFVYVSLLIETTQNKNEPIATKAHYIDGALSFAVTQTKDKKISALGFVPPSGLKELVSSIE